MRTSTVIGIDSKVKHKDHKINFRVVTDLGDNWFKIVGCMEEKDFEKAKKVITIPRVHISDLTLVKNSRRQELKIQAEALLNNAVI